MAAKSATKLVDALSARAFLFTRTDLPMPGSTKAPFSLVSAIASAAYASTIDATAFLEISNFPANCVTICPFVISFF